MAKLGRKEWYLFGTCPQTAEKLELTDSTETVWCLQFPLGRLCMWGEAEWVLVDVCARKLFGLKDILVWHFKLVVDKVGRASGSFYMTWTNLTLQQSANMSQIGDTLFSLLTYFLSQFTKALRLQHSIYFMWSFYMTTILDVFSQFTCGKSLSFSLYL